MAQGATSPVFSKGGKSCSHKSMLESVQQHGVLSGKGGVPRVGLTYLGTLMLELAQKLQRTTDGWMKICS
jgi:hypothetical protein